MFDVCLPRGPSRRVTTEWPPGVGGQDGRCAQAPPSAGSRPPTSSAFHMSCLRGDGPSFLRWSGRRPPRRKASALALRGGRVPRIRSRPGLPQSPTPLDRPSPTCVRRASASRSLPTPGTEAGGAGGARCVALNKARRPRPQCQPCPSGRLGHPRRVHPVPSLFTQPQRWRWGDLGCSPGTAACASRGYRGWRGSACLRRPLGPRAPSLCVPELVPQPSGLAPATLLESTPQP